MFEARYGFERIRQRQTSQGLNRKIQTKANRPAHPTTRLLCPFLQINIVSIFVGNIKSMCLQQIQTDQ